MTSHTAFGLAPPAAVYNCNDILVPYYPTQLSTPTFSEERTSMPVSQETAARADHPLNTPVYDRDAYVSDSDANDMQHGEPSSGASKSLNPDFGSDGGQPSMPSEEVQPGVADDVAQQGATQPGSGSAVTTSATGASGGSGSHQPTFKERVIGVAKKTRGATLGNTETKEQGERILQGQEVYETKKVGPGAKKERSGSI